VSGGLPGVRSSGCFGGGCAVLVVSTVEELCSGTGTGGVLGRGSVTEVYRWMWKKELILSWDFPCLSMLAREDRTRWSHLRLTDGRLRSNLSRGAER
jgi:hypothetical protein